MTWRWRELGAWAAPLVLVVGATAGAVAYDYAATNSGRFAAGALWMALEVRFLPVLALGAQAAAAVLGGVALGQLVGARLGRRWLAAAAGVLGVALAVYLWGCRALSVDLHDLLFGRPAWHLWAPSVAATALLAGGGVAAGLAAGLAARGVRWLWGFRLGRAAVAALLAAPLAVLGLALVAPWGRPVPPPARNVLLISMDTLRADHLGCYGYPRSTSPSIDRLAAEGVLFENAVTQAPWTLPAHMSLFTGLYPSEHGLTEFSMSRRRWRRLDDQVPLLAEVLARHGYATAAFTGGGFVSPAFGFGRGFDRYATLGRHLSASHGAVRRWLARHRDGPFLLFVHFYDCHRPYAPPAPFDLRFAPAGRPPDERFVRRFCGEAERSGVIPSAERIAEVVGQYDGAIAHADQLLGTLFDELERHGLAEQTLVVFFSDHGEEFFEHGNCDHIKSVYDPLIRVPLILRGPGVPRGARRDEPVELREVGQLVLDYAGVDERLGEAGRSVWQAARRGHALTGGAALAETRYRGYAIDGGVWRHVPWSETGEGLVAARSATVKLITDTEGRPRELYDLAADPGEQRDLLGHAAATRSAAHEHAAAWLGRWLAGRRPAPAASSTPASAQELDPATLDALRALGYVDVE